MAEGVLYRCVKYNNGAYFYTANPAEIQSIQDNYLDLIRFEGYAFSCLTSGSKPVYRFALTDGSGAYFYTADPNERATVAAQTGKYRDEGIQFYAAQDNDSSATPAYRLKSATGSYLYTANEAEKNAATSLYGYTYEQIAFRVPKEGTPSGFALSAGQDSQFANEGNVGTGGSLKYNVLRVGDTSQPASVQWSVKGTGSSPAEADDFTGATSGTLSFGAGEASKLLTVSFTGDDRAQADRGTYESFAVTLSNPGSGQILVGSLAGRILNDDSVGRDVNYTESAYHNPIHLADASHGTGDIALIGVGDAGGGWM